MKINRNFTETLKVVLITLAILPVLYFVGNWCEWRYQKSGNYKGTFKEWLKDDWKGLKNSLGVK